MQLDVTSEQSVQSFARRLENEFGRADVLVASAGVIVEPYDRTGIPEVTAAATVLGGDLDQVRETIEVNFFGVYRLVRAVVKEGPPFFGERRDPRAIVIQFVRQQAVQVGVVKALLRAAGT
jgi:NAD(P)-dependent dehydrogenase (short-subunit alcohol dehydrogenase family)